MRRQCCLPVAFAAPDYHTVSYTQSGVIVVDHPTQTKQIWNCSIRRPVQSLPLTNATKCHETSTLFLQMHDDQPPFSHQPKPGLATSKTHLVQILPSQHLRPGARQGPFGHHVGLQENKVARNQITTCEPSGVCLHPPCKSRLGTG